MINNPKLFISYSHDSEEHKSWTLKLATHLRGHGVNVILDQWDLRLGGDLPFFMEQGLSESQLVLCICSEQYVVKANSQKGGVGYEKMILTQPLLSNSTLEYIIPIVRNNHSKRKMPTFLGSKLYINFEDDNSYYDNYRKLIERIYNQDIAKKPELGQNPFNAHLYTSIQVKLDIEKIQYHNPEIQGTVTFDYSNNDKKYLLGNGEYLFVTRWSGAANDVIYAYSDSVNMIGYLDGHTDYPSLCDIGKFNFSSRTRRVRKGEIVVWVNNYGKFAVTKILGVKSKSHGAKNEELVFEYKIYTGDLFKM